MATTIKTRNSVTTTVVPTNLAQGELAVNITDKKIWVGNASTTPVLISDYSGSIIGGSNTQVQYNSSGAFAGSANFTFNGTTVTIANDASISGLTVGKGGGSIATNTVVGYQAQNASTSGTVNTIVGYQAGYAGTSAGANTLVGYRTGYALTSGGDSTFIGYQAGLSSTTSADNTAVGSSSLRDNTTGASNVALGRLALAQNTTASNNTAVGYQALYSNQTGIRLTAVGLQAGRANTASDNTFLGIYAGYTNTTGTYNVFTGAMDATGYSAGHLNTTGSYNTAYGAGSLASNTTSNANTAVGYQAGYNNLNGSNTFIGYKAGYTGTAPTIMVAVGYQAGYTNNATRNTYLGYLAGTLHTGNYGVFVGSYAGQSATSGNSNCFIGDYSGASVTTAGGNTFVGQYSGAAVTTGQNNTIIGAYDGSAAPISATGSNCIVLSDGAGNWQAYHNGSKWVMSSAQSAAAGLLFQNTSATTPDGMYIGFSAATPNNTSEYFLYCNDPTNVKCIIYSSGTIQNRTGTYTTISDLKLKENVVDTSPKLDKLNQVRVVNYNLIGDELKQIGFVAQELEQVFPSLVFETPDRDENGDFTGETTKGVKLTVMIPILVKAIQELKAEVDSLKQQLGK